MDECEMTINKCMYAIGKMKGIGTEIEKAQYIELKEEMETHKDKLKDLTNLSYSKGFWNNLMGIIKA